MSDPKCENKLSRYRKLLVALAAVASIYVVRASGLDKGLIDEVLNAVVESVVGPEEAPPKPTPEVAPQVTPEVMQEQADQRVLDPTQH